ncbi:hypothetical protein AMTRI_Chr09g18480 [Amborella trichopoda]
MTVANSGCPMGREIESVPLSPAEEARIVKEKTDSAESNLKEGASFYVLSNRWWRSWQEYVGQDARSDLNEGNFSHWEYAKKASSVIALRPGSIDNTDLVIDVMDEGGEMELRRSLEEGHDYVLVPDDVWKQLFEWYKGGPVLPRKMISDGPSHKGFSIEVYPLQLHLILANDNTKSVIRISKKGTVKELYSKCCELLKLDSEKVRIWDYFNKKRHALLTNFDQTLEDAQLQMDQEILLELQVNGNWPDETSNSVMGNELALVAIEPSKSSLTIAGGSTYNGHSESYGPDLLGSSSIRSSNMEGAHKNVDDASELPSSNAKGSGGGLTGLINLGNTCFMNSALQCLVHTPKLVEFFLQDYNKEINQHNPLGMKGELARAFGDLLRELWSPGKSPIAPRAFKATLARFASQFSGYNQHDSQELLAFLLDGLHEDLNRVIQKPYSVTNDPNGRPDEDVAEENWASHKARNDSIIVETCQGQYKSTVVCPDCSKVSVTFDPLMYMSLPLPSTATRAMTIMVFYGDGSALTMPFTVTVPKQGCCKDIIQALHEPCSLNAHESLLLAEVYNHQIYRYLDNPFELISGIKDDDHIVAYRLPANRNKLPLLQLKHHRKDMYAQHGGQRKFFGTPLITCLPEGGCTGAVIQTAVKALLAPLMRATAFPPPNLVKSKKESGSPLPVNDDIKMENCNPNTEFKDGPIALDAVSSFSLWLIDDRGFGKDVQIENDTTYSLTASSKTVVTMSWSEKDLDLYDISHLEDLPEVFKLGYAVKKTKQETISLFSCLEVFLKEEPLGPNDMWYCPSCKADRQAIKKLDLWRLPDILVVHLKRFSFNRYMKTKLDTFVNFPIHNLDLTKYVKSNTPDPHVYELYAVSNHYGSLSGGHYTAYVKLFEENRWYNFDDSHVSPVSEEGIKTSAAYVLFYRRIKK